MAALHEALKSLSPIEFSSVPVDDLKPFLTDIFSEAQLLVDSVPIPAPGDEGALPAAGRSRSDTVSSIASSSSEISLSTARPTPPPAEVESLQKQWGKPVRLNAKENPLGMSVYKLAGKDGKGAWFARRSIHEGLPFERWKKGFEREFPETMKVQGGPGEGNIRGIGGERRVEYKAVDGVGKMEVYHLSAQFPGPTTPRDFVTLLLTSDTALKDDCGGLTEDKEIPRHFMVVSKPCIHPDCPERDGFIRGQYQSVEFIREIPVNKPMRKSASANDLLDKHHSSKQSDSSALSKEAVLRNAKKNQHPTINEEDAVHEHSGGPDSRARGKTISFDQSRGADAKGEHVDVPGEEESDEADSNPVEWIMLTRSDPGGSVPRFMVERGTPSSIVADASKFLDWACSPAVDEHDNGTIEPSNPQIHPETHRRESYEKSLYDYQTNGHLAGLDGSRDPPPNDRHAVKAEPAEQSSGGGIFGMVTGAVGAAGAIVAAHTPAVISNHLPGHASESSELSLSPEQSRSMRRPSVSSIDSASSVGSFASAVEGYDDDHSPANSVDNISASSFVRSRATSQQEKEFQKLEDRKRKLDEKLAKTRERELSKKSEDSEKEAQAIAKAEERHQKEVQKQEEKYKKEMAKLEAKRVKEERKAEERRRKAVEKDERTKMGRELEEVKAERDILRVERDLLRKSMGDLQAENTALAARLGKMGAAGEAVLKDVKEEISGGGRMRASSMRGLTKPSSLRSVDMSKENTPPH